MDNIFDRGVCDTHIARIHRLRADTRPLWGKMNAAQMLAHVSKPYEMVCDADYARTHKRPPAPVRFLLKLFLEPIVGGDKPYKKNSRTIWRSVRPQATPHLPSPRAGSSRPRCASTAAARSPPSDRGSSGR